MHCGALAEGVEEMSDIDSLRHLRMYDHSIEMARTGKPNHERFLRVRLREYADTMPLDLLLEISEVILRHRRRELQQEADEN